MSTWNKNYHWKTKGCTAWSKQYFTDRLVGQSFPDGGSGSSTIEIQRLDTFDGDVELGNRKGKLITIYDVDMSLVWASVDTETKQTIAKGKLRFPEVSHEIEDQGDDYTWETTLHDKGDGDDESSKDVDDKERQAVYQKVKKDFVLKHVLPVIKAFRATLVDAHARDLGHEDSANNSGAATPTPPPASSSSSAPAAPASAAKPAVATPKTKSSVTVSSKPVEVEARQACGKEDLWDLLTNQVRIPMWTRAPAQFVPLAGQPFSLFNGNVHGKVLSSSSPNEISMSWRPPTWSPPDHFGTLTLTLKEEDDATVLKIKLQGVPEGEEDSSEQALQEFYLNGLKRLGLGTMM